MILQNLSNEFYKGEKFFSKGWNLTQIKYWNNMAAIIFRLLCLEDHHIFFTNIDATMCSTQTCGKKYCKFMRSIKPDPVKTVPHKTAPKTKAK